MNLQGWQGALVLCAAILVTGSITIVCMLKAPGLFVGVIGIAGTVFGGIFGTFSPTTGQPRMRQADIDLLT